MTNARDKYRPVHWSDLESGQIVAWGIERKKAGERFYKPVGYEGHPHPFSSEAEAREVCDRLNKEQP